MKLLAINVLYYPSVDAYTLINEYIPYVDRLIVWDNTPNVHGEAEVLGSIRECCGQWAVEKIVYMSDGTNRGLSYAYNRAIEYARKNGFTHIMTMDQDSKWQGFKEYRDFADNFFSDGKLAVIGPVVNEEEKTEEISRDIFLINSGSVFPVALFDKIGWYCERFLVYAVDTEICFRVVKNNIPVYRINGHGHLSQSFGDTSYFNLFGRKWPSVNYSPKSLKGILRNSVLLYRIYGERKEYIRDVCLKQYTIAIIFHERHKLAKLWAIYSGLISGMLTKKSLDPRYSKA